MGKTRPGASPKGRSRKARRHQAGNGFSSALTRPQTPPSVPAKSPRAFVDEAMAAMTQGDMEAALGAAQEALAAMGEAGKEQQQQPVQRVVGGVGTAAVLSLLGEIRLEMGDVDEARELLKQAAALDGEGMLPEAEGGGVDKFLYLAQLSETGGRDSVGWFERGAAALRARVAEGARMGDDGDDDAPTTAAEKLAQVLCAVAEVWMTDLSFEDDCEAQCERLTTEATLLAPAAPDVWQTLASVRISQLRLAEARAALRRSLELWEHLAPAHPLVPAYGVRVSLVRLLLTAGWLDKAVAVVARLLREDDAAVEVWYLAGFAQYLTGRGDRDGEEGPGPVSEADKEAWVEARRCLARCLQLFGREAYEDERLGQHAAELLAEVEAVVGAAPADENEEDEEEWEDAEEEEEDEGEGEDEVAGEDEEMG